MICKMLNFQITNTKIYGFTGIFDVTKWDHCFDGTDVMYLDKSISLINIGGFLFRLIHTTRMWTAPYPLIPPWQT